MNENTHAVTLSVIDLAKIAALEQAAEDVILDLDDNQYLTNFTKARARSEEYGKGVSDLSLSDDVVDVGILFKHLKDIEPGLTPVVDILLAKLDQAVVYQHV